MTKNETNLTPDVIRFLSDPKLVEMWAPTFVLLLAGDCAMSRLLTFSWGARREPGHYASRMLHGHFAYWLWSCLVNGQDLYLVLEMAQDIKREML